MRFHWSIDRHPVIWQHQMSLMKFGQQWLDLCKNISELPGNWPTLKQNKKIFSRQHEHYNREACLDHLSFCFRHNMGAPAFVNRYVNKRPAIAYPGLTGPGLGLRYRVKRTGRSLIILFRSFDEEYALVNFIRSSAFVFNPTWNYFPAYSGIILKINHT